MVNGQQRPEDDERPSAKQARELLDKKMPKAERGERFGDDWHDWLRCQILLGEAETLIEGRPRSKQ